MRSADARELAEARLRSDFNGDCFADLAVGAPGEDGDAGAVTVVYGTAAGLDGSGSQFFTQNSPAVRGVAEVADGFGSALAAADFDRDGFADLAIGVPSESIGGAVNGIHGGSPGLTGRGCQVLTQNTPGVGSSAEC